MTQRMVVEGLRRQYLWLDAHFNELFGLTKTTCEKDALRAAYLGSRRNLWLALEKVFVEDDPGTTLLYKDLMKNLEQVEMRTATGGNDHLIELIGVGVGLGSRLSSCGLGPGR